MFTIDNLLHQYYPKLNARPLLGPPVRGLLRRLMHERRFADFSEQYPGLTGMDFVEQVLDSFQFFYAVTERERENIPVSGRLVIVANHPIGTLDGLALLKLVHDVRQDVRIVANDVLASVQALAPCLLPVRMLSGVSMKRQIAHIEEALHREEAVIFFPAGVVSRIGATGIRDGKWQKGFLRLAAKTRSPILPIHIRARNSARFYATSLLARPLSTIMLVGEMFRRRKKPVQMTIGGLIPFSSYDGLAIREKEKLALFRRHLYRVGAHKSPVFRTETAIARPERRVLLHKGIREGELLGRTPDGMEIYLFNNGGNEVVFREIARLRELTFRLVGEGSGKRRDRDQFDRYYHHLVLWSSEDLEIVGSYRFADAAQVIAERGLDGLYSHSLFALDSDTCLFLQQGVELGRSFVQQRYWGKRSLDYLWFGIGAFLKRNPQYRYLFGPVSISNAMPRTAKELLIIFYRLYFTRPETPPCSRNPFCFSMPAEELATSFSGKDYRKDFTLLKSLLAAMGVSVPTLYKQYTELCEAGGVYFLDFNVDPEFADCIDGLVVVDIALLKEQKRKRYIDNNDVVIVG
ncbi:MAG: GNAT family N-acetyltransferase [Desulfobulbaceae bacterium]|nr:GNAT family N-acetyltransferase [Desulfobulbaceae bacterium]